MATITFAWPNGDRKTVDVALGSSVMEAAVDNDIDEIVAECGGCMSCATCHVYVDEPDLARMPPRCETENAMLDGTAAPRKSSSRLSCQLVVDSDLDGITVLLPSEQY